MGSKIPISSETVQQRDLPSRVKSNHFNTYFRDYCQITFEPGRNNDKQTNFRKTVMRRHIILEDNLQLEQFYETYIKTQKIPFNLLFPTEVTRWNKNSSELDSVIQNRASGFMNNISNSHGKLCTKSSIASVYFEPLMTSLVGFCVNRSKQSSRTKRISTPSSSTVPQVKGLFDHQGLQENQIWFIINEISHSIATLKQNKHAHWNINPQTIFCNTHQNFFIHDSYFVFGPNFQNFLQYKLRLIKSAQHKSLRQSGATLKGNSLTGKGQMLFMSEQLMRKVQKGTHIDFQSGSCEDIYGLGNSILYVMGMPKQLLIQKDPFKRFEHSINFLTFNMAVSQRYSEDLLSIVGCMIQPLQNKRISINRLREKLAPKQKKIINQSIIENKQKQNQFNRIQRKPQQSNGKDATKIGKNVNDFPDKPFKNTNGVPSYRVAQPYVHSQQIMEPVSTSLMIQYIDSLPNKPQSHLERVQSQKHFSTYNFIGKQLKEIDLIDRKQQQKNQNILNQVSFINKPGMKHFGSLSKLK